MDQFLAALTAVVTVLLVPAALLGLTLPADPMRGHMDLLVHAEV